MASEFTVVRTRITHDVVKVKADDRAGAIRIASSKQPSEWERDETSTVEAFSEGELAGDEESETVLVTLEGDGGPSTQEYEVLGFFTLNGKEYAALVAAGDEGEDPEILILAVVREPEGGRASFSEIEDDDEYRAAEEALDRIADGSGQTLRTAPDSKPIPEGD